MTDGDQEPLAGGSGEGAGGGQNYGAIIPDGNSASGVNDALSSASRYSNTTDVSGLREALNLTNVGRKQEQTYSFSGSISGEWENLANRYNNLVIFMKKNIQKTINHDWTLLAALLLLTYTANLAVSYYVAFFPQYARKFHFTSPFEIGVIMCGIYISIVILNPVVPKLIDETGISPEQCLFGGFLISGGTVLWLGMIEDFPGADLRAGFIVETFLVRVVQGVGVSLVNVSAGIVSLRHFDGPASTESGNLLQFSIALGYMSGPPIGAIIYHFLTWGKAFLVLVGIHVAVLLISAFLYCISRREELGENEGGPILASNTSEQYRTLLYNPLVLFLLVNNVIAIMEFAFMHPTLGIHMHEQIGSKELAVGIVFLVRDIAYAIAFVLLAFVQKFTGPFLVLMFGHALSGVGYFLLGPASFLDLKFSLTLVFIAVIIVGIGVASPQVSTLESLLLVVPLRTQDEADLALKTILKMFFVILNSAFYTGSLLGTALGGVLQTFIGSYEKTFMAFGIALFIQSILVVAFAVYLKVGYNVNLMTKPGKKEE